MSEVHRTIAIEDGRSFSVVLGSIVEEEVDAIVNAANGRLAHGGGVAAVISGAAGPALDEASRSHVEQNGPVPVGEAVVTTAGELPHRGVIHAVGPRQGDGDEEEKLTSAVAASLDRAEENDWTSVALPAISAGVFAVPYEICARAYLAGARRHFEERPDSPVEDVRLVLFDPDPALLDEVEAAMETHS